MELINNHIHTIYSFSPYTPTEAVLKAFESGLATAGIMDHDSVGGALEFIEAGKKYGLPVTVGFECRVSMRDTPFFGKRLNNPDQMSVAYMAMHGIPRGKLAEAEAFLKPLREKRNIRNQKMVEKLNCFLSKFDVKLNFENDILPLSMYKNGGSVTERHILYALACKITNNEKYRHFLLGMFKSQLIENIYIDAEDELPSIADFIKLSKSINAIPAYAYLGDVGDSVTGDKKTQEFEDAYLDELIEYLKKIGVQAVTYMPTRNTKEQLTRLIALCKQHDLFQISGEDINSPFQSFVCEKLREPQFSHLINSAWALIGHEYMAEQNAENGMFSDKTINEIPDLDERIKYYMNIAKGLK